VIDLLMAASAVLMLDQWSKRMAGARLAHRPIDFGRALRFRQVFSAKPFYTRDGSRASLVAVWLVALVCAVALHSSGATFQGRPFSWGAGAALGGAAGNLLDILRRRAVLDFIDLRWWPVFNIADVGIVVGLVVAFWPRP